MAREQRPGGSRSTARERAASVRADQERARRRRSRLLQAGVAVALVVVVLLAAVAVLAARDEAGEPAGAPAGVDDRGAVVLGAEDAAVRVDVVEDFQCPACQAFEAAAGTLLDEAAASGDVQVAYHQIAFLDRASTTEYASRAANAAACTLDAAGAETWKELHDLLYAEQPPEGGAGLDDAQLVDLAVRAGAEEDAVASCVEDGTFRGWVEEQTTAAFEEGVAGQPVSGTPTVVVDGETVEATPEALQAAIDAALAS